MFIESVASPIQKIAAIDFREKELKVGGGTAIFGIRFLNGNPKEPFVGVVPDFTPNSGQVLRNSAIVPGSFSELNQISLFKKLAIKHFSVFSPKYIQVWFQPSMVNSVDLPRNTNISRRVVAGFVNDILYREFSLPSGVSLESTKSDSYFDWYKNTYSEFHLDNPHYRDLIPVNTKEEMDESLSEGLLYWAKVDGEKMGLIGGVSSDLLGANGLYMNEVLLAKKFRGQGYAPIIQRLFIEQQKKRNFDLVWGTIDAQNKPSTKSALRVGRKSIREELLFPI